MIRKAFLIATLLISGAGAYAIQTYDLFKPEQVYHPSFGTDCDELRDDKIKVTCVTVFYGTNRNIGEEQPSSKEERDIKIVGGKNDETLHLGRADIWLPSLISKGGDREKGETPIAKGELPEQDDLASYVFLTRITTQGKERFVTNLQEAVYEENDWSLLLFVHGFNVDFNSALIRTAQLSVDLNQDGAFHVGVPVLFSWPSVGKIGIGNYKGDQSRAAKSAEYLDAFLDILTTELEIDRINIIAHSMGNRVLTRALEDYADDYLRANPDKDLEFRIILSAADVDALIFKDTVGILEDLRANVSIYTSDSDRALAVSKRINKAKRLGETGVNKPFIHDHPQFETIDATGVATELFGLGHSYYSDNPTILGDMTCWLLETDPTGRSLEPRYYADNPDEDEYFKVNASMPAVYDECGVNRLTRPLKKGEELTYETDQGTIDGGVGPGSGVTPPPTYGTLPDQYLTVFVESRETGPDPDRVKEMIEAALELGFIRNVQIVGHTDQVGGFAENRILSKEWAEYVRDAFVAYGLPADIISVSFEGENSPRLPRPDGTDEPLNRRVEIIVSYQ